MQKTFIVDTKRQGVFIKTDYNPSSPITLDDYIETKPECMVDSIISLISYFNILDKNEYVYFVINPEKNGISSINVSLKNLEDVLIPNNGTLMKVKLFSDRIELEDLSSSGLTKKDFYIVNGSKSEKMVFDGVSLTSLKI